MSKRLKWTLAKVEWRLEVENDYCLVQYIEIPVNDKHWWASKNGFNLGPFKTEAQAKAAVEREVSDGK